MAKGKNKKLSKKGKVTKRGDKHTFSKKEWFQVISPAPLEESKPIGWTCCKKPTGTQVSSDFLKNRVAEMSLADLSHQGKDVTKRIKIQLDDIQGNACYTSFHSYELAKDKVSAIIKKRQSLIEIINELKTNDGAVFRITVYAVTIRKPGQLKLNSYAKSSRIRILRKKVLAHLQEYASENSSRDFIYQIVNGDVIGSTLKKVCTSVIPNSDILISKLKLIKRTVGDTGKANEQSAAVTQTVTNTENPDAVNLLSKAQ
mgnify:CR=1 FL=1